MTTTISQLVALWYETIGGLHHKDRDCHFAISQHWAYAGEVHWFVDHTGYLLGEHTNAFPTREAAETYLKTLLIDGIKEWLDCEDGPVPPARREEILAILKTL